MLYISATQFIGTLGELVDLVGVLLIVGGVAIASLRYGLSHARTNTSNRFQSYRVELGRALLLGLEFLVAADIIRTVAIEPTFTSLGVLALIVVIRTFLSWALELEIDGHWPWQKPAAPMRGEIA